MFYSHLALRKLSFSVKVIDFVAVDLFFEGNVPFLISRHDTSSFLVTIMFATNKGSSFFHIDRKLKKIHDRFEIQSHNLNAID